MTVKNATQLLELCENVLGYAWDLENGVPVYKQKAIEAGKINKKIKTNPKLYTFANLELAVEYSWKKRMPIKSPMVLFYRVEQALKAAAISEVPATEALTVVREAVDWELAHQDDQSEEWIGRLLRAEGRGAIETYKEWKAARNA